MKKIVVAVVAMLAIGTSSFAQGFGWGVKAGLNVSGMNNTELDSKTGLTAGVFVDYRFNDWIGMSADLLFSREGAMLKSGGDKYIAKTNLPEFADPGQILRARPTGIQHRYPAGRAVVRQR